MRKVYFGIFFCIFFFSFFAANVSAQDLPDAYTNAQNIFSGNAQAPGPQVVSPDRLSVYDQQALSAARTAANPQPPPAEESGWWSSIGDKIGNAITNALSGLLNIGIAVIIALAGLIAAVLNLLAAAILEVAVFLFDITLDIGTNGISQIVNGGAAEAIRGAWTIIRDLVNIFFVFILLYIAINFILSTDSAGTKKLLSNTILAALLINFSFFFAALVVDVSNMLAIEIAHDLKTQVGNQSVAEYLFSHSGVIDGVAQIKKGFGMHNADTEGIIAQAQAAESGNLSSSIATAINWAGGSIMALLMTVTLIVVLFAASFMIISRTIAIIFLLITSPIAFGGYVLPYTKKIAKEWWQSLIGNAFFLPAFLLFLLIAFKIIENGFNFVGDYSSSELLLGSGDGAAWGSGGLASTMKNLMGVFIQYAIVIGLFIAALTSAKKLSSMGSDIVTKLSGGITSTVGGAALGGAGLIGRNTIGWGANKMVNSEKWQERLANRGFGMGNLALKGLSGVAGSSFDARGSRAFSGVASATGLGDAFGKAGGKGGFAQQLKDADGRKLKFAKDVLTEANADKEKELLEKEQVGTSAAKRQLEMAKVDGDKDKIKAAQQRVYDAEKRVETRQKAYDDARNKRKIKFAGDIGDPTTVPMKAAKWTRDYVGSSNRSAGIAKKIMKEATKSKTDELLETLIKVEKDQNVQDRVIAKNAKSN